MGASQRTQVIQNLEGGILHSIEVREGQIVEKGDVLARLDNEMAESSYRDAVNKALENQAAILITGWKPNSRTNRQFRTTWSLPWKKASGGAVTADVAAQAAQLIRDQQAAGLRRPRGPASCRIAGAGIAVSAKNPRSGGDRPRAKNRWIAVWLWPSSSATSPIPCSSAAITPRRTIWPCSKRWCNCRGTSNPWRPPSPRLRPRPGRPDSRIAFRKAELDTAVTEEINKRRLELASLRETLAAGGDRVTRTEVRSPVRGTVKQIALNTLGGVVKPGEAIMEIVPLDDTLLVEARVRPQDVAFLRPGQHAQVKITAYDFSIYGGLEGILEQISADTIEDKRGGFYYLVKVRTKATAISYRGEELPIIPGMMATVDIMIGKKTVLGYLLKPILKARQNALHER